MVVGCKTTAVVAPVVHNKDSVRVEVRWKHDSIYTDRWHTITLKGDTIIMHDSIIFKVYKELQVHDTIIDRKTDSIPYPVVVKEELTGSQRFLMNSGIACWVLVALIVIIGITVLIIRLCKK